MRRILLMYEDAALFNVELSQSQYDFFQKHAAAFRRMCEEQSSDFWVRFIMTFRSFTNNHGYLKDFPHKKQLTYILDFAYITVHEIFVDAKFKDTKNFIADIVTIARHRILAAYCETKKCMNGSRTKNPFFVKETRDVFRRLFGSQNEEQSYLKALILIPLYLRFGGSVMTCLRRWLDAPPLSPGDTPYWVPEATQAVCGEKSPDRYADNLCSALMRGHRDDDKEEDEAAMVVRLTKKKKKSKKEKPLSLDDEIIVAVLTVRTVRKDKSDDAVMETGGEADGTKVKEKSDEDGPVKMINGVMEEGTLENKIEKEIWNDVSGPPEDENEGMEGVTMNITADVPENTTKGKVNAEIKKVVESSRSSVGKNGREEKIADATSPKGQNGISKEERGGNGLTTTGSGDLKKSKVHSGKKRTDHSGGTGAQPKPLDAVVENGVPSGDCHTNKDSKIKGKLRQCANCKVVEPSPKVFKKCQKCKVEKVGDASYYCSRECQVCLLDHFLHDRLCPTADDWVAVHKAFHKTFVQL